MNAVCEPHVAYDLYENRLVEQQEQRFGERYEDARCEECLFYIELIDKQIDEIRDIKENEDASCDWCGESGICAFSSSFMNFVYGIDKPCDGFEWRNEA